LVESTNALVSVLHSPARPPGRRPTRDTYHTLSPSPPQTSLPERSTHRGGQALRPRKQFSSRTGNSCCFPGGGTGRVRAQRLTAGEEPGPLPGGGARRVSLSYRPGPGPGSQLESRQRERSGRAEADMLLFVEVSGSGRPVGL
jgi:la-related protein 4